MAEKVQFFPLDVTYKVINDKAVIHLYGRTVDGEQICVIDDNFEPYFYVIAKKTQSVLEKLDKLRVERNKEVSIVAKTEVVNKKYLSKDVEAIKVYTKLPRDVPVIREEIKGWPDIKSEHEYDIQFSRRYLIDKKIIPTTIVEANGNFVTQKSKVPVLKADSISQISDEALKKPKILSFDIETYTPFGKEIVPEKNPIIMLSFCGKDVKKVFTWKKFKTELEYVEFVNSEAELIQKFRDTIEDYKPDIITGYFSDGFDLPYIKTRAEKYKIKLDIGHDFSELKIKTGKSENPKITGIVHVDIFKFIKRVIGAGMKTEYYNLNAVAAELLGEKKQDVNLEELPDVWDNKPERIEEFCKYNMQDSILTFKLCEKMLPNLIELVKIVGLPIYDANRMGFSQLVESYLLRQAPNFNEIAPNKPHYDEIGKRKMPPYKGALVYAHKPGLYDDIVVFDYRSLYPTIISSHNISPGTLCCSCCEGEAKLAPTEDKNKYWFCKKKKGFIPTIIEDLITRRIRIKEIIKEEGRNVFLDARENSLKLLANSFYGYLGFFGARWYSIECARSVTAWGRFYIHKVIDKAKNDGFKVLYSDTDSVFLTLDGKHKEDVEKFSESINIELPGLMELEYEGFYPRGIFVSAKEGSYGAKKKYALLSENNELKIRGFESVRRNWSFIAKDVQENVLKIILREKDIEKAFEYVKKVIDDLREKKVPLEKVIIHTQLQKEVKNYDSIGPHVKVARRMEGKGISVGPGSMIRFIVVKGDGSIGDRSRLPEEVKEEEYDADYYTKNQVVPAVERIFNVLGYNKEELLESKEQRKLGKFFG